MPVTETVIEEVEVSDNEPEPVHKPASAAAATSSTSSNTGGALDKPKGKQASLLGFFAKKPSK